jgi:hypothetical protein
MPYAHTHGSMLTPSHLWRHFFPGYLLPPQRNSISSIKPLSSYFSSGLWIPINNILATATITTSEATAPINHLRFILSLLPGVILVLIMSPSPVFLSLFVTT